MSFSVKMLKEDICSGYHLASSMALKPHCILWREQQSAWCCCGVHHPLPPLLPSCFLLYLMAFGSFPPAWEKEGKLVMLKALHMW